MDFESLSLTSKIIQCALWIGTYLFVGYVYWTGYFHIRVLESGGKKIKLLAPEMRGVLPQIWCFPFFTIEIVSIWKWFATTHLSFWEGFKELIWATVPLVNITYSWDWIWGGQFPIKFLFSLIFQGWFIVLGVVYLIIFGKIFIYLNENKYEKIRLKYALTRNQIISFFIRFIVILILFFAPIFLIVVVNKYFF